MPMDSLTPRVDSAFRLVRAPAEAVYAAMTRPAAMTRWLAPDGTAAELERFDFRPGGRCRVIFHHESAGSLPDAVSGAEARVVDLVPDQLMVLAVDFIGGPPPLRGTMRLRWELDEVQGGTRVTLSVHHLPAGISSEESRGALAASLAKLARQAETPAMRHLEAQPERQRLSA